MTTNEVTFNPSYIGRRPDILRLVPKDVERVLDIGCSVGTLGEQIKQLTGAEIYGIELDFHMAEIAEKKLDRVIVGNIEDLDFTDQPALANIDCIIFADVLEHLRDPWGVLKKTTKLLGPKGIVIASIPNIRHYTTILNLLVRGYWPYVERGIHDKTHLRFFTLKNIVELFESANLKIFQINGNYRIIERPHRLNKITRFIAIPPIRNFLAFQYLVSAKKVDETLITPDQEHSIWLDRI